MKKIGIGVDNYKLEKFKNALTEMNLPFTTAAFTKDVTLIFVMTTPDDFDKTVQAIAKMCKTLEINFKLSN